jgi:hypothetical protein
LKFPILKLVDGSAQVRGTRPAYAPSCNDAGGYMKGEPKGEIPGKTRGSAVDCWVPPKSPEKPPCSRYRLNPGAGLLGLPGTPR